MKVVALVVVALVVVAGMALHSHYSNDGSLSESAVKEVVQGYEAAKQTGDVSKGATYVSSDCVEPGPQKTLGCIQLIDAQNKSRDQGMNRHVEWTGPEISIKNGVAHARVRETINLDAYGKHWESVTDQDETIEMRNGHMLVTGIESSNKSTTVDGHTPRD